MRKTVYLFIITSIILAIFPNIVTAQDNGEYPIYIVQPGETLSSIANKFDVDLNDLITINNITNSNLISAGTQLRIPGLQGISGTLSVSQVEIGEDIKTILKRYELPIEIFLKLNKITSPSEIYIGSYLVLPVESNNEISDNFSSFDIRENASLITSSVLHGINPWYPSIISQDRDLPHSVQSPGETFFYFSDDPSQITSGISPKISQIEISPLPLVQGHTVSIKIFSSQPLSLSGLLGSSELNFYKSEDNTYLYALDGIHALEDPGLISLKLNGVFEDGDSLLIDQLILLESGGYPNENLTVESTLIDEQLNIDESQKIQNILTTSSNTKYWNDYFRYPVDGSLEEDTIGFSSYFGGRRSYNNGEYYGFHGGLDFWVLLNSFNIYATAPGVVVFAGPMDIRGFTTFIDHGNGVYSGYAHQKEILVEPGQFVNAGDLIGLIGATGRVTGPHLHWDIWVNGKQVDPFDWIYNQYP